MGVLTLLVAGGIAGARLASATGVVCRSLAFEYLALAPAGF